MLARSQNARFDHNQENPNARLLHHKTPARLGKNASDGGPAPATAGKGVLQQQTAKSGRILGAKDRNGGKTDQQDSAVVPFPGKPGTLNAQGPAGSSSCAPRPPPQQFKTPLPNKTLRPAQELRTPATALRPKHAPPFMLDSPEVSMEADADEQRPDIQEEEDREVEYAGPSARDYDEPYIPDHLEPDYKTAGFGAAIRSMPFFATEDPADWARQDALDRSAYRAELDDVIPVHPDLTALDAPQPLFPVPKRRTPLSAKPANTSSRAPSATARTRAASSLGASTSVASAGKSIGGSSVGMRRPLLSATGSAKSGQAGPSTSGSSLRPAGSQPPSRLGLASSKPSVFALTRPSSSTSNAIKPLQTKRVPSVPPGISSAARPRPPPLSLPLSRQGSSASLRSASSSAPLSPAQIAAKRRAEELAAERELGIFGVVEDDLDGLGLTDKLGDGANAFRFGDEESFKLDLDL